MMNVDAQVYVSQGSDKIFQALPAFQIFSFPDFHSKFTFNFSEM